MKVREQILQAERDGMNRAFSSAKCIVGWSGESSCCRGISSAAVLRGPCGAGCGLGVLDRVTGAEFIASFGRGLQSDSAGNLEGQNVSHSDLRSWFFGLAVRGFQDKAVAAKA